MKNHFHEISTLTNDPKGLPIILDMLRERREKYEDARNDDPVDYEDMHILLKELQFLHDALGSWKSQWPNEWAIVVKSITPYFIQKHLDYSIQYGVFQTVELQTELNFMADMRRLLIYALAADPWRNLVDAAAASMELTTIDVHDSSHLLNILRNCDLPGKAVIVHNFCGLTRSDYGVMKMFLMAVEKEKDTALFGLSLREQIPTDDNWADYDPCDASCLSFVYPHVFPDELRRQIMETRSWTVRKIEQAIVDVLMNYPATRHHDHRLVCSLTECTAQIRNFLSSDKA